MKPSKNQVEQVYRRTSLVRAPQVKDELRPGQGISLVDEPGPGRCDEDRVEFRNGLVLSDQPDGTVRVELPGGETYAYTGELEVDSHHVRLPFEVKDQNGATEQWVQKLEDGRACLVRTSEPRRFVGMSEKGEPRGGHETHVRRDGAAYVIETETSSQVIVPPVPYEQFFA